MLKKTDAVKITALKEQVNVSVIQAILKVIGQEHTIKVLSSNIEVDDLQPVGQEVVLKMVLNVYPKE